MLLGLFALGAAVLLNGGMVAAQSSSMVTRVSATQRSSAASAQRTSAAQSAQGSGSPCSSVSSMSVAFMSMYPRASQALVPAQAAADCLKSVPLIKSENSALIDEMKLFVNWQSNLAYLREPPKGYTEERVDVIDELDRIQTDLNADKYNDDYSLMFDLQTALVKTYDFHFGFRPDITSIIRFRRGNVGGGLKDEFGIVSVSTDGRALPKLYNYYDIMFSASEGWTPSPIQQINNQSADDYVQNWAKNFEYHEDHARYNRLFPNQAQDSMGSPVNQFGRSQIPDGDYTYVTHENGSNIRYFNNAIVPLNGFTGVRDGRTFYQQWLNRGPPRSSTKRDVSKVKRQNANPTATNFPTPQILHSEGVIGGYYLSGQGYDDVAVLSVPSFGPDTDDGPEEFQDLIGSFLKSATGAGKKKLVIDLRGNGGGRVFLGYDLFKQLFPSMDPYGASTFRANQAFNITGLFMTEVLKDLTYEDALRDFQSKGLESNLAGLYSSIFNYKLPNTIENKNFTSWQQYFGPEKRNNDAFTVPQRKDLNNFFSDDLTLDVTGYRTRANKLNTQQPFEAKDIVLLQDGGCGSTCAVFSEFMKAQAGVQTVVTGGLPKTGPMQGVAGTKGSQVWSWSLVAQQASLAYKNVGRAQQVELNKTELGQLVFAQRPLRRTAYSSDGQSLSGINLRDNIREGDTSVTPLEFVYEAADCRIFNTAEMVRDTTNVWKKTVDAHWGDASKVCVDGSTGDKSSLSGGFKATGSSTKKGAASSLSVNGAALAAMVGFAGMMLMQ